MNVELIRHWLNLPAGNWPPDHYSLLALRPKEADAELIERRTHERIAAVRPYQLNYPEEVTEVLNRLAAAFNCLTDAAAKKSYDASLGTQAATDQHIVQADDWAGMDPADPLAWLFRPWDLLTPQEPGNRPASALRSTANRVAGENSNASETNRQNRTSSSLWHGRIGSWIIQHPETALLVVGLFALLVALIRHWSR
jgi:hypothetical protein